MAIVDTHGNPISSSDFDTPQTEANAKLAQLHKHYSEHPTRGLTPSKIAAIMREAEQGDLIRQCELAEDMEEKDAHIQSELGKRRLAWQGPDWQITPPSNASAIEKRDAEMIEELLRSATWLDTCIFDAGDAILKTFANQEIYWAFDEGLHYIADVEYRDPSWFSTHPDRRNELRLRDGSAYGEALQPFGWISHTAQAKSGYLSRRGLVRVLAWPFLFKNYSVRDLAEFLEIYGLPMRLGKYPDGATKDEKLTLLRAVMSIGHNAGGIIPQGMQIEFEKAAEGGSDPFMAMINWCEKSQSKAILGGTLTTQADGKTSTNALGNVHNEVRKEIRDADLKALQNTFTRDIVFPLYQLNGKSYRSPRRMPRFEFVLTEPDDLDKLVAPLEKLVSLGYQVPVSWVAERTQIPEPVGNEPVLTIKTAKPKPVDEAVLKGKLDAEPTVIEQYINQLGNQLSPELKKLNQQIQQAVDGASDYDELEQRLLELGVQQNQLGEVLHSAMLSAELAGRADAQGDSE